MPRYFLLRNGINPDKDFAKFSFSGAHDATVLWVESGKVDAGALNEAVWDKLVQTKKVDTAKVLVFWTTPPFVDYVWAARGDLDQGLRERIATALLKLDNRSPEDKRLLICTGPRGTSGSSPRISSRWKRRPSRPAC